MSNKDTFQAPFRVECQLCGTLAESWHASLSMPSSKTAGRGFCECGVLAIRLGKLFGNGAGMWIHMQSAYDVWHASRDVDVSEIPTLKIPK